MEPVDGHESAEWDGYTVLLHPAVHARVTLRSSDGLDLPMYVQKETIYLGAAKHPLTYRAGLSGGEYGQEISLSIDDPHRRIVCVTVELLKESVPFYHGQASNPDDVEVIRFVNGATTCPPFCEGE